MRKFMKDNGLREFRFFLEKILRDKPHTLGETVEQILAMSQEVTQASVQVFGQLDNVDLNFGTILDDSGTEIELSHGNFSTFLINPNREIRKKAFFQYYQAYEDHKNTLAATLAFSVKKDRFYWLQKAQIDYLEQMFYKVFENREYLVYEIKETSIT